MFIGLWTYVDDAGRGVDDARLIKSALWPLDDTYVLKKVEHDLDILAEKDLIIRYTVLNRNYLAVCNWKEHQKINRPQESSLPAPCALTDDSVNDHGTITDSSLWERKGKERKGKELKSGEHVVNDPLEEEFNQCWENYPKKVSRLRALKAYKTTRRKGVAASVLALAVSNYSEVVKRKDTKDDFILHGSTFFGPDSRWEDYKDPIPLEKDKVSGPVTRSQRDIALGDVNSYRDTGQDELADELQAQIDAGVFD
jgi:hypothetical protein